MQPSSPRTVRSNRTQRSSTTPTTPSRASHALSNFSSHSPASPAPSTAGHGLPAQTGPARFPTTLVRLPHAMSTSGLYTQTSWTLPPFDTPTAMLFTAIAMELDSDDPSPSSAPHVGLYWAKGSERIAFFDYIVTMIHKLVSIATLRLFVRFRLKCNLNTVHSARRSNRQHHHLPSDLF